MNLTLEGRKLVVTSVVCHQDGRKHTVKDGVIDMANIKAAQIKQQIQDLKGDAASVNQLRDKVNKASSDLITAARIIQQAIS